jgi:transcriptional regulator with XRE-family HTH domain
MITDAENEIKADLVRYGIKQKELAQALRVPASTLAARLNGFSPLPVAHRILISEAIKRKKAQVEWRAGKK